MATEYKPADCDVLDVMARVLDRHDRFRPLLDAEAIIEVVMAYSDGNHALPRKATADIKQIPAIERAKGAGDFRIRIDAGKWAKLCVRPRRCDALFAHELTHLQLQRLGTDGDGRGIYKRDVYGRLVATLIDDDWEINGFKWVAEEYGEDANERVAYRAVGELLSQGTLPFGYSAEPEPASAIATLSREAWREVMAEAKEAVEGLTPKLADDDDDEADDYEPSDYDLEMAGAVAEVLEAKAERSRAVREDLDIRPDEAETAAVEPVQCKAAALLILTASGYDLAEADSLVEFVAAKHPDLTEAKDLAEAARVRAGEMPADARAAAASEADKKPVRRRREPKVKPAADEPAGGPGLFLAYKNGSDKPAHAIRAKGLKQALDAAKKLAAGKYTVKVGADETGKAKALSLIVHDAASLAKPSSTPTLALVGGDGPSHEGPCGRSSR